MRSKNLDLFLVFLKMGAFTFGGGYAMLPLIEKDVVRKYKMINEEEMTDIIAVSESTPGPLAINCATFVGYKVNGFLGALISTFSVVLPSFIVILIISLFLEAFLANQYVSYAFNGIRIAVSILVLEAGIKMFIKAKKNVLFFSLLLVSFLISTFLTVVNPAFIILGGGLIGFIYYFIYYKVKDKEEEK